jgi:hypothetical protein
MSYEKRLEELRAAGSDEEREELANSLLDDVLHDHAYGHIDNDERTLILEEALGIMDAAEERDNRLSRGFGPRD